METVGGLITATTGRIPSRGERVRIGEVEFEIVDATDRKITSIAIKTLTVPPGDVTNVG
jgi:magnesium and cobalt transporter